MKKDNQVDWFIQDGKHINVYKGEIQIQIEEVLKSFLFNQEWD